MSRADAGLSAPSLFFSGEKSVARSTCGGHPPPRTGKRLGGKQGTAGTARTSNATSLSALGNTSKMKDSSLMPVFSVGFTVSPVDASAYGIFLRAM